MCISSSGTASRAQHIRGCDDLITHRAVPWLAYCSYDSLSIDSVYNLAMQVLLCHSPLPRCSSLEQRKQPTPAVTSFIPTITSHSACGSNSATSLLHATIYSAPLYHLQHHFIVQFEPFNKYITWQHESTQARSPTAPHYALQDP